VAPEQQLVINKQPHWEVGDSILKPETKFAYELLNVFISSYLKDLFVNSSFPIARRLSHPAENDDKVTTTRTIRSYKNQAKSESAYIICLTLISCMCQQATTSVSSLSRC